MATTKTNTTAEKIENTQRLTLASPWIEYYHKIKAMFDHDDEVFVTFDEDQGAVKLCVEDPVKADALTELLNSEVKFGNVTLKIDVIPANNVRKRAVRAISTDDADYMEELYSRAFNNNTALHYVKTVNGWFSGVFVVFAKEVVQYYNDDLGDIYGMRSTLYQEIAKDIFKSIPGVFYNTDVTNMRGFRAQIMN